MNRRVQTLDRLSSVLSSKKAGQESNLYTKTLIMGLPRISSVSGLNVIPHRPIEAGLCLSINSNKRVMRWSLLVLIALSVGVSMPTRSAGAANARVSLGRQEPPKANPGRRYAPEIFKCLSVLNILNTLFAFVIEDFNTVTDVTDQIRHRIRLGVLP